MSGISSGVGIGVIRGFSTSASRQVVLLYFQLTSHQTLSLRPTGQLVLFSLFREA